MHAPIPPGYVASVPAPDRWVVVPQPPTIAANTLGARIPIELTGLDGVLVSWKASIADPSSTGLVNQSLGAISVVFNGLNNLVYNGEAEDFANIGSTFSQEGLPQPFWYRIDGRSTMTVQFQNISATTALRFSATFGRISGDRARRLGLI